MLPTELQILLDLSSAISSIRNKDDLFRVILEKINPVFNCTKHAVVLTIDAEAKTFRLMLCEVADMPAEELAYFKSLHIPIDTPLQAILDSDKAVIFQTEPLIEKDPENSAAQFNKKLGIKEIIACRLQVSGKTIGAFSLHAEQINHFKESQLPLFEAVSDLVALAVKNILAGEETQLKEHQKSQLLNISTHIATVRDRNDLFRLIAEEMKAFIDFDDVVITIIDEETESFKIFLSDVDGTATASEEYQRVISRSFPLKKGDYSSMIYHPQDAFIIDVEAQYLSNPEADNVRYAYEFGVREEIVARLTYSGKIIGVMGVLSKTKNRFTQKDVETVRSLSSLFAIALNNILSNQQIELREQQKSQLLTISKHIANVRDKNDLFHLITKELKSFIHFDTAVISVLNEESNSFGIFLSDVGDELKMKEEYQKATTQVFPIEEDSQPYRVVRSAVPLIVDIEKSYFENPGVEYMKQAYNLGMREEILTRLVHSGKVIGALALVSMHHGTYTETDIQTVQSLSNLFAIALNNILANQELEERNQQKSQLLSISTHIATIRDKKDLFRLIAGDMKTFIDFDDVEIAIIDEERQSFKFFLSNVDRITQTQEEIQQEEGPSYPIQIDNPFFNYQVFQSDVPFVNDIEAMHFDHPQIDSLKYVYNLGMREEIVSRLFYSGKIIGIMSVLSKTKNRFTQKDVDTVRSLSSLIAIALNNILSNQEIEKREQQKSQLLKISYHIATIREKGDLFHLIAKEMQSFIHFDDVVIATIDEEKQTYTVFLSDVAGTTHLYKDYQHAVTQSFPIDKGSHAYKIYQSEKPIRVDIVAEHLKNPEIDSLKYAYKFGMKEEIIARLTYSGKVIGMIGFLSKKRNKYTRADMDTVQSLSSLVAIALNNILANQEIELREHQKSQLLRISQHISTVRGKEDLFRLIAKDLKSFIHFDDAVITLLNEEKQTYSIFLVDPTGTTSQHPEFKRSVTANFPVVKSGIHEVVLHSDKAIIIDVKKEHFKNPALDSMRLAYNFGMRSEMAIRLTHSGKVIGFFAVLSKQPAAYTEADTLALQSLSSMVAIALNNILTNEEIERLSSQLAQDNVYLNEEIKSNYNFEEIIGESLPIQEVFKKAVQVAHVDSTVLILGETGTGKELIARAIHNLSSRKNRPLIKVNCAALPAQLIESELFGHEKGSFTGATDKRTGKFELANGSTIFLDEIGELPLELQAKLLRVLQEKEIERIGGEKSIKVDVRIIAATNRNLENEVAAGKFRSDLYYRLNIYPVELPPLRERKEDIPLLASFFLQKLSNKLGKKITSISPGAMEELVANDWPGNIRELEHTIERSMLLTSGKTITNLHLSKPVIIEAPPSKTTFSPKTLANNEKELIVRTLKHTRGKIRGAGGAAELLDILPTTLEARMKKLGIKKEFIAD